MADKNAHYLSRLLHHHGFLTRTDVTSRFIGHDQQKDIGRADTFAALYGRAVNVEVKRGVEGFNMEDWRTNQREWAEWSSKPPFSVPYFIFLTIGKHPPHYNEASYMPRRSWLIPREAFLAVDQLVRPIQKTLPMRIARGMKKAMQENGYDAIRLLAEYELTWQGSGTLERPAWLSRLDKLEDKTQAVKDAASVYGGFWIVPEDHVFYRDFVVDKVAETLKRRELWRLESEKKEADWQRKYGRNKASESHDTIEVLEGQLRLPGF